MDQALATRNEVSRLVLKNDETEDEKDNSFQAQFKSAVKSQQTKQLSEKTYGQLTPSQIDSARMSETSYINLVDGPHSAQKYAKLYLPEYKWDRIRSTEHIAVFVNKKTNKVRLGFRGTQTAVDWKMNGRTFTGTLGQSSQIKEMDKTVNEIFNFYGKENVEIMSGHSKGGSGAYYFGEKYGVDTHLQDPAISVNEIIGGKTKANHHVAKTPNDVVSMLSNVAVFRKGITTTDVRQEKAGFLNAHALSLMSKTDYKKSGNTAYNPKLKSQAFLLQQLNEGKSPEQIVKEIDYSSKESRQELREEIKAIQATPETHEQILKDSGFAAEQKPTSIAGKAKASIGELVVPKIDAALGQAVDRIAKVTSAGGIAGILSAVGTSQALAAVGSTNEIVNEGIVGAVSNASQDAAASAYAHIRNRGHHVPVTNALRALPNGSIDSLLAESTSGVARTAEEVASAGRMASIGTRALASLARGGVSGVIGAGVQIGAQAILQQLGMDEHTAKQVSRLAGAVAAGAMFGPQAVAIFVAIEAFTIAFEEVWNFFSPHEPEISPFQQEALNRIARANQAKENMKEEQRLYRAQGDEESIRLYGMTVDERNEVLRFQEEDEFAQRIEMSGSGLAEFIWRDLQQLPQIMSAQTPEEINNAIREIFLQVREENPREAHSSYNFHGWKRDLVDALDLDSKDVPQFDNNGYLIVVRASEMKETYAGQEGVEPNTGEPQWTREWDKLQSLPLKPEDQPPTNQTPLKTYDEMTPEEQSIFIESFIQSRKKDAEYDDALDEEFEEETEALDSDDYEDYDSDVVDEEVVEEEVVEVEVPAQVPNLITEHVYSARQGILTTINNDAKIKQLRLAGDTHGVNKAIRELFMKNSHSSEYNGTTNYGDPQLPQLTPDNELIYQTFNEPTPTTETAKQENNNI